MSGLSVLAVDDEPPALDELTFLLECSSMISSVRAARSAAEALHLLQDERYDVVLLDIAMPGIDGLELARILARFSQPPAVVFVTAHEEHALAAFDAGGMGYLLKPVTLERLTSTLRRVTQTQPGPPDHEEGGPLDALLVETGTLTRIVPRDDISWVESAGDYVRLHVRGGAHYLLRLPISALEEHWSEHGFARIHRSYLVALRDIHELRTTEGHTMVRVGELDLPVSRRHAKELRDRLVRQAQRGRHDAN
jgi:two-component system, LytTR family, response regulator LytT